MRKTKAKEENEKIILAGQFIFKILIFFAFFNLIISLLAVISIQEFYAQLTLSILNALGFSGEIIFGNPVLVQLDVFNIPLGFTYLCTGLLELSFLLSAILATPNKSECEKVLGLALGIVVLFVFNLVRIIASVLAIYYINQDAGIFSHDILFRVSLIFVITAYYYYWINKKVKL